MSTMKKLKNAKDRLAQAEQEVPGAYESAYTGQVNDRLDKIGGMNDTGVTDAALSEAFQSYRDKVAGNAADSAAAALGTAQGLSGGYGTDWTKSVVNQTAQDQTASAGTTLAELRSKALQQWQNELAGNTDMVSTLLGQDSMERSAAAQDTANAQSWRNYLYGRLGQARQENSDFLSNAWNIIKGIGSVAKAGYDGYMGYTQIKLANEVAGQQQAWEAFDAGDPERARQILKTYDLDESMVDTWKENYTAQQNRVNTMNQAVTFLKAGSPDAARTTLTQAGMDTAIVDNWQGLSDVDKEKLDYLLSAMDAEDKYGNDTGVQSLLQMAGIDTGSMDYSDTLKQKDIGWQVQLQQALNNANLQYQKQQYQMKNQYGSSGRSGRSSGSSSSGSSGYGGLQYSSSNVTSMMNKLAGMSQNDPMYSIILGELRKAGVDVDGELGTGITTKRMQVAANAAQGQQSRGSDEQTIYNSLRLQGYSEDEIAYAMGTLK
ncbi:hypothetical protein [Faecalibacterium sp. PGM34]